MAAGYVGRGVNVMDETDTPPWERPWCNRRVCEPHRAGLLSFLGRVSVWCGILYLLLLLPGLLFGDVVGPGQLLLGTRFAVYDPLPSLVGLVTGVVTGVLGLRDWRRMRAGTMDAQGRE